MARVRGWKPRKRGAWGRVAPNRTNYRKFGKAKLVSPTLWGVGLKAPKEEFVGHLKYNNNFVVIIPWSESEMV